MSLIRTAAGIGGLALLLAATTSCDSSPSASSVASSTDRPTVPSLASTAPAAVSTDDPSLPATTDSTATVAIPLSDGVSMMVNARVRSEGNRYDGTPGVTVVAAEGQTVLGVSFGFVLQPPGDVTFEHVWGAAGDVVVLAPPDAMAAAGLSCQVDPSHPAWCRLGPFTVDPPAGFTGATVPYGAGIEAAMAVPRRLDLHRVRVAFETADGRSTGIPTRYADPGQA